MKKVLLGLVIAVMMTGSGYAYEQKNWDRQNWSADLKEKSCEFAHFKSVSNLKIPWYSLIIHKKICAR